MNPCKLCSLSRKFIRAHAMPEAFFRELRVDGESPLLVSGVQGNFPKRAPIGVYDEGILCEMCEPTFGLVDEYGIDILLKRFNVHFQPLEGDGAMVGFESTTVSPLRLLQFLVTVLWRASVSTHPFYSKVKLGPHEGLASAALPAAPEDVSPVFNAVLSRWREEGEKMPTTALLDPRQEKWFGVNAYRLYFGEVVAYVKVDSRPFHPRMQAVSLRAAPPVLVVARAMSESKDYCALKRTAKLSSDHAARFRDARHER